MRSPSEDTVRDALSLIQNERGLPYPSGPLLQSFVSNAFQPVVAASYVLHACGSSHDPKAALRTLVADWTYIVESVTKHGTQPPDLDDATRLGITRRDGAKCCITGKPTSFRDPLVILPVLPVPSRWLDPEPRIAEMLRAFFGTPYRDWWLGYTSQPDQMDPYSSHWLVRRSASRIFSKGLLRLNRLERSWIEYQITPCITGSLSKVELACSFALLGDHSRSGIPTVDARLVGTQCRLSPSIRWLEVRKHIAENEKVEPTSVVLPESPYSVPERACSSWLSDLFLTVCLKAWRLVPSFARLATYNLLARVGRSLYGPSMSLNTQQLPFGLYLKTMRSARLLRNEFNALNMVRRHTSIPVPRALDVISVPAANPDYSDEEEAYLLTSRIPGIPLERATSLLSDRDTYEFMHSMFHFVAQLRTIPRADNGNYAICNTLGEACRDPRIWDGSPVGPFKDEAAFSQYLYYPDEPARRGHDIVFTHADLNLRNILVDHVTRPDGTRGWKVVGLVDWETTGFYPDYWECTKAQLEGWRYEQRWPKILYNVFRPFADYSEELKLEVKSWRDGDGA